MTMAVLETDSMLGRRVTVSFCHWESVLSMVISFSSTACWLSLEKLF